MYSWGMKDSTNTPKHRSPYAIPAPHDHEQDLEVVALLAREANRQECQLSLIASENHTWPEVLKAAGSVLTDKYAEGYPARRYYAGCAIVDEVECLAIQRCKDLFGVEHVNVQPHAGSQANIAVYTALLKPGDTVLAMHLAHGGHLTHGHEVNLSGMLYNFVHYGVDTETECLDYDEIERLAKEHKPRLIIAGASAYSRIIDFARFGAIAKEVNALLLTDIAHIAGLVAAGLHPSPVDHADVITSTTHKTLRGPRGGFIMCRKEHAQAIDRAVMPGTQGGPFMHAIAAKAVAFGKALHSSFVRYQEQVVANARAMVDECGKRGYRVVSGGTDNHMFIIDLRCRDITGRDAELLLQEAGINVSRSCIPFEPQKPWITSGIRIGTPAMTSRSMSEAQAREVIQLIDMLVSNSKSAEIMQDARQQVASLCKRYPVRD